MKSFANYAFYLFLILLFFCLTLPLGAQTGCNTGVILTTQAEVDAFNFTGVFDGSIEIGGLFTPTDITNLDALNGLTGITNAFSIINNPLLTDISGLSNLTFLGQGACQSQRLIIWDNPLLADLSPLSGMTLSPASRSVDLRRLPEVTSLSSLGSLTGCRELRIMQLDKLTDLDGINSLEAVSFIDIRFNALLASIDGLAGVTESWNPGGEGVSIDIVGNPTLMNLNGLVGLTDATSVEILDCDALVDLTGMGTFLTIGGKLDVQDNDGLTSLEGLNPNLEIGTLLVLMDNTQLSSCAYQPICDQVNQTGQFGEVSISGNAAGCADVAEVTSACAAECGANITATFTNQEEVNAFTTNYPRCNNFLGDIVINEGVTGTIITDLSPLSNLRQVGTLRITSAPNLSDLSPLASLDSVHADLDVRNTAITVLDAFTGLHKIGGRLTISNNSNLVSITSFGQIEIVPKFLTININPLLSDLSGFNNLVTVGDVLELTSNPSLPDLTDFSSLRFAFDGLTVNNNDLLTSLTGLETLENINAGLRILNNALLTDISTLNNLDQSTIIATSNGAPGTAALIIRDNPLLSNCAIETVCTFLDGSGTAVDIQGNAVNCESQTVVENNCLALPITLSSFTAQPADKTVHLTWQTASEENTQNFTLERSADGGRTFTRIGSVAARNAPSGSDYYYLDETAAQTNASTLYYRLQARDFDGASEYFGPVAATLEDSPSPDLTVIPNPAAASASVQIQVAAAGYGPEYLQGTEVEVLAMDGRLVATLTAEDEAGAKFTLPGIPPGVYLLRSISGPLAGKVARFVVR